jgi:hypothetical protein
MGKHKSLVEIHVGCWQNMDLFPWHQLSVKFKNAWSYTVLFHTCSWCDAKLSTHFTLLDICSFMKYCMKLDLEDSPFIPLLHLLLLSFLLFLTGYT